MFVRQKGRTKYHFKPFLALKKIWFPLLSTTCLPLSFYVSDYAIAQTHETLEVEESHSSSQTDSLPFIADEISYDETNQIVHAKGNVQINYKNHILLADEVIYNQKNNDTIAIGHIRLIEPTGEIIHADYLELKEDLSQGFIDHVKILLSDNARIVANDADRFGNRVTRLNKAAYSPCDICEVEGLDAQNSKATPLWQIKAQKVFHDQEKHNIYYQHAFLEFKDVPVLYTPYLSHTDPTVKRRTGFLVPSYGVSSALGSYLSIPYYIDVAPDKDATLNLITATNKMPVAGGEWRQRFSKGETILEGSITRSERFTGVNDTKSTLGHRNRGHIFAEGDFDIDDYWRWGYQYKRASDSSYLRRHNFKHDDILVSDLFLERFSEKNYTRIIGYDFQDLRPDLQDAPHVMPWVYNQYFFEPDSNPIGGQFELENDMLYINRTPGADTQRFSGKVGWQREDITNLGFTSEAHVYGQGFAYVSDEVSDSGQRTRKNVKYLKKHGQAEYTLAYPLSKDFSIWGKPHQHVFEPIVQLISSPNQGQNEKLPNEDSKDFELDINNLFVSNRFSGLDRTEGGNRMNYGLRNSFYDPFSGRTVVFVGQSFRFRDDQTYRKGSGFENHLSDYLGSIQFIPSSLADLQYDVRLDQTTFKPKKHFLMSQFGPHYFRPNVNYLYINQNTIDQKKDFRQEIQYGFSSKFTEFWTLNTHTSRNLGRNSKTTGANVGLTYENECFKFISTLSKDYTRSSGLEANTSFYMQFVFKTMGTIETPVFRR